MLNGSFNLVSSCKLIFLLCRRLISKHLHCQAEKAPGSTLISIQCMRTQIV